jgi:hypothetical protein
MATSSEISRDISNVSTLDELRVINAALSARWKQLQRVAVVQFRPGDRVQFLNRRNGETVTGFVVKINQKSVSMRADSGVNWKVAGCLLKPVE